MMDGQTDKVSYRVDDINGYKNNKEQQTTDKVNCILNAHCSINVSDRHFEL